MNESELTQYCYSLKNLNLINNFSIIDKNGIPFLDKSNLPGIVIQNTISREEYFQTGKPGHWILWIFKNPETHYQTHYPKAQLPDIELWDSLAGTPFQYKIRAPTYVSLVNCNTTPYQSTKSFLCGGFALYFAVARMIGYSILDIHRTLDETDFDRNDNLIRDFLNLCQFFNSKSDMQSKVARLIEYYTRKIA